MVVEQHSEQTKLDGREMDLFFSARDSSRGKVDANVAKSMHRVGRRCCTVSTQGHAKPGLQFANAKRFDQVIIRPGVQRGDFIREVRQWSQMPIIVLSARAEETDKIAALDAGADDYLSKPFGIGELQARLRVALRRHSTTTPAEPVYTFSDIQVDLAARRILRGAQEIHLTPIEFRLLAILLNNHGKVLTQRQLLNQVWGPNAVEHSHYLRIYMGHLRQKLEDDPARPRHLLTETGIGYRFML